MSGHRTRTASQFHRTVLTGTLVGGLILGLAACGGDKGAGTDTGRSDKSSTRPEASPSASAAAPSGPHAAEKAAAVRVYLAFWGEQVKAYETGSLKGTNVRKYTGGSRAKTPAYFRLRDDVKRMQDAGSRNTGAPGHDVKVTRYTPKRSGKLPLAEVVDCMDISGWKTVKADSGEAVPLPSEQPRQFKTRAKVELWPEGWQVLEIAASTDRCGR